jgi:nicotinate-nucleotide pyrophosphorylase (carboxylating)
MPLFTAEHALAARHLINLALAEDLGPTGDRTTESLIPDGLKAHADFVFRQDGILAGMPVVKLIVDRFPGLHFLPIFHDGSFVSEKSVIGRLTGPLRSILAVERTALNFLQRMSGVSTKTYRFTELIRGTKAVVLDTRKTSPGWRLLDKYAVDSGGGTNHRVGLYDGILIKDNHLACLGPDAILKAIKEVRAHRINDHLTLEIEVDSLDQFDRALPLNPDIILLDNMHTDLMSEAVRRRNRISPHTQLEASGGINEQTIRAVAETGVDRISVGAITHSAPSLDIALDMNPNR